MVKQIIFLLIWIITILVRYMSLRDDNEKNKLEHYPVKKVTLRSFFDASYDFAITAMGFVYSLSDKTGHYELGLLVTVVLLLLSYAFSVKDPYDDVRRVLNFLLIVTTFGSLFYLMFCQNTGQDKKQIIEELRKSKKDLDDTKIRRICTNFINDQQVIDEGSFLEELEKIENLDRQRLFAACLEISRGVSNKESAKNQIDKISKDEYLTDKTFLLYIIDSTISRKIDIDKSYLGIGKDKLQYMNNQFDREKKKQYKILILDASGGKKGQYQTTKGELLKDRLSTVGFSSLVEAFPYKILTNEASKLFTDKYEKKFIFSDIDNEYSKELQNHLINTEKIPEFGKTPGAIILEKLKGYNCLIVYH